LNRDSIVYKGSVADEENPFIVVMPLVKVDFKVVKVFTTVVAAVLIGSNTFVNVDCLVSIS